MQALILKAITKAMGGGLLGGAGPVIQVGLVNVNAQMAKGGILGAANGVLLRGGIPGRDSIPFIGQAGEAVLPRRLTEFLQSAAQGKAVRGMARRDDSLLPRRSPQENTRPSSQVFNVHNEFHINGTRLSERELRRTLEDNADALLAGLRNMLRVAG